MADLMTACSGCGLMWHGTGYMRHDCEKVRLYKRLDEMDRRLAALEAKAVSHG